MLYHFSSTNFKKVYTPHLNEVLTKRHFFIMDNLVVNFGRPAQNEKMSTVSNSERNGKDVISGILHAGSEEIKPGTLHGGEEIKPGTLHGGEEIKPGTLHGGEEIKPGTLHGGEEIKPGTLHNSEEQLKDGTLRVIFSPATYRTKDGNAYYKFSYVNIGGKYEVDIIDQPSYQDRDSSAHITHRLPSSRGGRKICVTAGCEPTTIEAAKNLSMQWAELTNEYIKSGATIDEQVEYNSLPWWKKIF